MKAMFLSVLFTTVQFVLLIWLLWTNTWLVKNPFWMGLQIAGIVIGIWAIFEMQKSKLNIAPNVRKGSVLVFSGPYRVIRHPMYLALLLFFMPMLSVNHRYDFLILLLIFVINLMFKLTYEENLLMENFDSYLDYKEKTWRLVPYVY